MKFLEKNILELRLASLRDILCRSSSEHSALDYEAQKCKCHRANWYWSKHDDLLQAKNEVEKAHAKTVGCHVVFEARLIVD